MVNGDINLANIRARNREFLLSELAKKQQALDASESPNRNNNNQKNDSIRSEIEEIKALLNQVNYEIEESSSSISPSTPTKPQDPKPRKKEELVFLDDIEDTSPKSTNFTNEKETTPQVSPEKNVSKVTITKVNPNPSTKESNKVTNNVPENKLNSGVDPIIEALKSQKDLNRKYTPRFQQFAKEGSEKFLYQLALIQESNSFADNEIRFLKDLKAAGPSKENPTEIAILTRQLFHSHMEMISNFGGTNISSPRERAGSAQERDAIASKIAATKTGIKNLHSNMAP